MTTPKVQYSYANGSANTIRPTRTTYPNGRELNLDYGSAGGMDDLLSRVGALVDDDGVIVLTDNKYLGLGTPVITDYQQPDIKWTMADLSGTNDPDTGDIYSGWDRFGRVKDNRWYNYGTSTDADRIKYGYDRAGNRIWRNNTVANAASAHFDELYSYDSIERLKDMERGTLSGSNTSITNETFAQCWTLDSTGNWKGFREDSNGDGSWDLVQSRTANPVNEITGITNSVGSSWVTPAYNAAGNMTTVPKVADPTVAQTFTYDAWNRLVKITEAGNTVSEYAYDGANRRILQKSYSGGTLSETRHFYYTANWQVIEERVDISTSADRQFVWGLRYIDDLVLRDRGSERFYCMQDANWNVTAISDAAGNIQERYAYSAYGMPMFLTPSFGSRSSSSYGWETLYCGYRFELATLMAHVRHRILLVSLGAWGQRDPQQYLDGVNIYQYTGSSPLSYIDPTGNYQQSQRPVFKVDREKNGRPITAVDPTSVNCMGYALGKDDAIHPGNVSIFEAMEAYGWECTEGISAIDCKQHCDNKPYIMAYIYISNSKKRQEALDFVKGKNVFKDKINWTGSLEELHWIDYHFMRGVFDERLQYRYQPRKCKKGADCDKTKLLGDMFRPTKERTDYFDKDHELARACCCSRDDKK